MLDSGVQLSEHFSLDEFVASHTADLNGVDNTPPADIVENLRKTATHMERVRAILGVPIRVTSGYRCHKLNALLGSKATSDHVKGMAVDFVAPAFGTPLAVCQRLAAVADLPFKQLIFEHTWTHISWSDLPPKREVLTLMPGGTYAPGIVPKA